jgi:molybdenum-dependent DNA-binding transcriptional regulator ModE
MLNTDERLIKHKLRLLNLAEQLGNVSKACQAMGLSRDSLYRYTSANEEGGVGGTAGGDRGATLPGRAGAQRVVLQGTAGRVSLA